MGLSVTLGLGPRPTAVTALTGQMPPSLFLLCRDIEIRRWQFSSENFGGVAS